MERGLARGILLCRPPSALGRRQWAQRFERVARRCGQMAGVAVICDARGELLIDLVDKRCSAAGRWAARRGNRLTAHVLRLEPDSDDLERLAAGLDRRQHGCPLWLGLAELMAV